MRAPFFQVDAFAERPFGGNPAAVLLLDAFPKDELLQAVAAENQLSETAFVVPRSPGVWSLRWLTPKVEVPLCGHATLAAAHVLYHHRGHTGELCFETLSGPLYTRLVEGDQIEMTFRADPPEQIAPPPGLAEAVGAVPTEVWKARYLLALFESAEVVRALSPDLTRVERIVSEALVGGRGNLICAAPGDEGFDCVSRFFAPAAGIPEDPTTGSAHCILAPLFSERLGKSELRCSQAYPGRGGVLTTRVHGDRVDLIGRARTVIEGSFLL